MGCTTSSSRQRRQSDKQDFSGLPDLYFGDTTNGMQGCNEAMSILLVFPPDATIPQLFVEAAHKLFAKCELAHSNNKALEMFINQQHDIVVLDRRYDTGAADAPGGIDADALMKSMKAITHSGYSTFVAVTRDCSMNCEQFDELIKIGYNRRFREAGTAEDCYEELATIRQTSFLYQQRLSSFGAVLAAVDRSSDAVEITDDKFCIQYVNSAYEKMFGYSSSELVGKFSFEAIKADRSEEDLNSLTQALRKGKELECAGTGRRKSGASAEHHNFYFPVKGRRGKVQQFVCLKRQLNEQQRQQSNSHPTAGKDGSSLMAAIRGSGPKKDSSAPRVNSVTIDAPINKVVSLINSAQENCTPSVASTLDQVLEILHQSHDLYTGELSNASEDKMTSDYVGGLMTGTSKPIDKNKRQSLQQPRRFMQRPSEVLVEHISQLLENSSSNMHSLSEIPEEYLAYLEGEDEWSFDILELERVTDKKPMVYLAMKTLQRFNVCQFLQCSEDTMLNWLQVMQDHYHADNFYHNATHGADVMQSSAYFLERDRIKSIFDEMDEVASLLGALVHDLDHPGRTNPFLINSQHKLSVLYNDISVLESHHVSLAFQLTTRDDRINIFKNMCREDYKTLRQSMIDIVLATEMAKHFEHVGKFANQIVAPLLAKEGDEGAESITEEEALEMLTKPENRVLIKRVLIKCSDVSNPCRSLKLCKQWAKRISEEYFQQTDEEKANGLPIVMPVFDRTTCNMPHSQTSFIDFFLREMFTVWHSFCNVPELLENLNNNYAYWKQLVEENKKAEEAMREREEASGSS